MASLISSVEVHHLRVSFADLYGGADRIPPWVSRPAAHYQDSPRAGQESVIVRLRTTDGLDGVGESWALPAGEVTAAAIARGCAPALLGADPRRIAWLWERMFAAPSRLGQLSGPYLEAIAGVDIALWDLLGKVAGLPIHVLLGGPTRDAVPVYAGSAPFRDSPEQSAAHARDFLDQGYPGVKVKVGRGPRRDAEHVLAIRREIGPTAPIMLDANCGYHLRDACHLAGLTADADIAWLEDPLPAHDIAGLAELRRRTGLRIAAGENAHTRYQVRDLVTSTPVRKLAPALLCGNAVLFKPAESTFAVAAALVEILTEAGVPADVVDLVFATGATMAEYLADTRDVDAVSFTGSTTSGFDVLRRVADRGIRVQAELGGKNAVVLHHDADLERALPLIMTAGFGQTGQRCSATSRLLVHRRVHDRFVRLLRERVAALRVGDGLREDTDMGPVANTRQFDNVLAALANARSVECVTGGHRLVDGEYADGLFVAPTVLDEVPRNSPLWTDEIFGPVLSIRTFEDLDDAIAEVNDSAYGLAASIFTDSLRAIHQFLDNVNAGNVTVNLGTMGWDVHIPFGGVKSSGLGQKEQGTAALAFYSTVRSAAWGA